MAESGVVIGHGQTPDRGDPPIDLARYIGALRRNVLLIALIVVPLTAAVLAVSMVLPKSYRAEATLVVQDSPSLLQATDSETTRRRMATFQSLLTSRDTLAAAARDLKRGETAESLRKKVAVSSSDTADILNVDATDRSARHAADIANGVAQSFLSSVRQQELSQLVRARRDLESALDRLRRAGGADVEIQAIRERLSQLSIDEVSAGQGLQLAEAARPPKSPHAPKPLQNTIFGLFAATFLAVLVALARDRLAPRVGSAREFSRLTGVRPLAVLPDAGNVGEAFQAFQALQTAIGPGRHGQVVAILSVLADEDRPMVSAGLARALAASGTITVAVATDLDSTDLVDRLGVPKRPGLSEALTDDRPGEQAIAAMRPVKDELQVLPSGVRGIRPPAALLGSTAFADVVDTLRDESEIVVLDAPPLLRGIEGRLVGARADALVVVCRLDGLSPADADDLRAALDEIDVPVLGAVLLGGHGRASFSLGTWKPERSGVRSPA